MFVQTGIPIDEEDEEPDTSIKGRLMALVYKIKGRPQKTEEEPTEQEQAAPSKPVLKQLPLTSIIRAAILIPSVILIQYAFSQIQLNCSSWPSESVLRKRPVFIGSLGSVNGKQINWL